MLAKIFASLLITFGAFAGAHFEKAHFGKNEQFNFVWDSVDLNQLQSVFRTDILELPFFAPKKQISIVEIPPQKLPLAADAPPPPLAIKAGIAVSADHSKVFYQKNADEKLPVASLTKLLTALVVKKHLDINQATTVSRNAVATYGEMGGLMVDERISIKNLLFIMLIESSNDAAVALAEAVEEKTGNNFILLMNQKAQTLEMKDSEFTDPSGLNNTNLSTAMDLLKLTTASLKDELIYEIINTQEIEVFDVNNRIKHRLKNTNSPFTEIAGMNGGKTGYTHQAGECMTLIINPPQNNTYFIIILGADIGMRFTETKKLVKWIKQTYGW